MDGGAQAGLVAMAGHAFGVWELGPQREALLQWDLGVSAGPARVAGMPMVETFMKPSKAWDCVQGTVYFSSFGDQRPVLCSLSSRSTGSGNVLSSKICGCHFRSPVPFPPSPSSSSLMGCVFR